MLTDNISDIVELVENENVIVQKASKYWNQQNKLDRPDGKLIITNHRIIFASITKTAFTKTEALNFSLDLIENLEAIRVMIISPAVRFSYEGKTYIFTLLKGANEVVDAINNNCKNQ